MMIIKLHIMSSPADLPVQYHKQPFPTEHGYASKLVSHVFIIEPQNSSLSTCPTSDKGIRNMQLGILYRHLHPRLNGLFDIHHSFLHQVDLFQRSHAPSVQVVADEFGSSEA